MKSRNGP
jgi:hypothetical protein